MNNTRNRCRANYKTEVEFLRCFVNHYSFVTGLAGRLSGKEGNPEDSSVGVNVLLNANVYEGYKVKNPMMFSSLEEAPYHNVLEGSLFQCCDLLSWIAGTYDSKQLKEHNHKNQPTEFTIETWIAKDNEWQLKYKTHWSGVKWLDAAHTGDGGDRACAGIATFTCESKVVEEIQDGPIVNLEQSKHSYIDLRRVLLEQMAGPKHPASYMG